MSGILAMITTTAGATSPSTITLNNAAVYAVAVSPSTAEAGVTVDSDGFFYFIENGSSTQLFQWCNPAANANLYESYATLVDGSGGLTSGTLDTWQSLGTDRSWTVTRAGVGIAYSTITIGIRAIAGGDILASGTYELNASVES